MNYLQNRKHKKKRFKFFLILSFIIILFIIFNKPIFRVVSSASHKIFRPALKITYDSSISPDELSTITKSKADILDQNRELKLQLEEQEAQLSNYNTILNENLELKEIMYRKPGDLNFILASILSKPNSSPYGTLLVDIGSSDGVTEGALVFALGNIPIGRVAEVFSNSAKIVLFSSAQIKTQAASSVNNIFTTIYGRGGGNFEVDLPRDTQIKKGDEFSMPGIYPYTIAVVQSIISDSRASFSKALLISPVNIQEIKFVQIILQ